MDSQGNELQAELKTINATLQQLKDSVAQVMAEVKKANAAIAELPSGEKWVPSC